jgi:predicted CXXCH cytochrome family protein
MVSSKRLPGAGAAALVLPLAILLLLPACSDQIVWRDRPLFDEPAPEAGGFLGYSAIERKQTVCGNCHIGKQRQWERTAHAGAWATLSASPAAAESCQACHSVSSLGNLVSETGVGWVGTKNARYQDVQCESCHGPGLTHVLNPDVTGTKPLAPLAVGANLTRGCGECHSGVHRPFQEEWASSLHGRVPVGTRSTNASCTGCHEAKSVLKGWGITSTFIEQDAPGEHMAITCAVCHDPHEARHPGQLRFALDVPSLAENLCMKCHQKRGAPEAGSTQGPHSPEGPLLLGTAGWIPPGFTAAPGSLVGSHGPPGNPRLCATCHVTDYQVRDALTGSFTFRATGHSFQAIPCVDAQGIPTGERSCDVSQRSFRACADGCHSSEGAARSAYVVADMRMARLAETLQGLLARIPAAEFAIVDGRHTTALGARFNLQLVTNKPGSKIHNPFLVEALLLATIRQIETDYGLRPLNSISLEPQLTAR